MKPNRKEHRNGVLFFFKPSSSSNSCGWRLCVWYIWINYGHLFHGCWHFWCICFLSGWGVNSPQMYQCQSTHVWIYMYIKFIRIPNLVWKVGIPEPPPQLIFDTLWPFDRSKRHAWARWAKDPPAVGVAGALRPAVEYLLRLHGWMRCDVLNWPPSPSSRGHYTVDGSEIQPANLEVKVVHPIICNVFFTSQVVGNGISEASTVQPKLMIKGETWKPSKILCMFIVWFISKWVF